MKITVRVHPNSKQEKVVKASDFEYEVYFNVVPEKGQANRKMVAMLAEYFKVSKMHIIICAGEKSKAKIVEII